MKSFLIALQFLTRVPVKFKNIPTQKDTGKSLLAYPLVGLFIGLLLTATCFLLPSQDPLLQSALVLTVWVSLTGALHLDGLADSADALVGGFGDKERTLAIMKDPYCGPVGVVTLLVVLLLKFSALTSIFSNASTDAMMVLLFAPIIARSSILWSFLTTPYAKKEGLAQALSECFSMQKTKLVLILSVIIVILFFGWSGIALLIGTLLLLLWLRRIVMNRIGGMTGDTLGAQVEIIEVGVLLGGIMLIS